MTVYVIWKSGGIYDDYREEIVNIYAKREDAEKILNKLVRQEQKLRLQFNKCCKCPALDGLCATHDYCAHLEEVEEDESGYFDCEYYDPFYEEAHFWIKEYEVF